jgi:hypothetical protein
LVYPALQAENLVVPSLPADEIRQAVAVALPHQAATRPNHVRECLCRVLVLHRLAIPDQAQPGLRLAFFA